MGDLTIREAQTKQPWTVPYSNGVALASCVDVPHILATHAVLHAMKTLGKLATVFEALDHKGGLPSEEQMAVIRGMAADLMTAALRLANLYEFDLSDELEARVLEKNGVPIRTEERATVPAVEAPDAAGWYWLRPTPAHAWRIVRVEGCPEDGLVVTDPGVGMGTVSDWKRRYPEARWAGPIPGPAK